MTTQPSASHEGDAPITPKALRALYEAGAAVDQLVTDSDLSYGTVLNRLREAGTVMRTPWQTRRLREDGQARWRLAARLCKLYELYEQHGATLTELAAAAERTRPAAQRLLIEAGGIPRTSQQTLRLRSAAEASERQKLAVSLRAKYEADASVPELAKECNYSVATVYRLLREAGTRMRAQHQHGPARRARKRP